MPRPLTTVRPLGRRAAAAVSAGMLLSLAACGGTGSSGGKVDEVEVLTQQQAEEALLSAENLSEQYRVAPDDQDDNDDLTDMGCLTALGDLEEKEADREAEVDYEFDDEMGLPVVFSAVSSYAKTGDLTDAFERFRSEMEGCDRIEHTDEDGATMTLDLTIDDEKVTTDVDDQINFSGTGSIESEGFELPMGLWFTVARVDNHLTMVGVSDLGDGGSSMIGSLAEVAVDRLVAVASGEEPPATEVAAAERGTDPAEEEGGGFESLPLDGGSYTWDSGITLKMSVERVEPWGATDDFCGDGSCGVANPDDTRFVLKYEVTVPETYSEPFDPMGCPGQLHATSGSDDEALSPVAGDHYRELGGKIFPGSTKFGVDEYYIEKAYADQEFYIESSCGDPGFSGETAYFVGPIDDVS